MSYDFRIVEIDDEQTAPCTCCGRPRRRAYIDLGDPTYNLGGIFSKASGGRFAQGKAMELREAAAMFRDMNAAIQEADGFSALDPRREEWRALEPENGWGDLETAERVCRATLRSLVLVIDTGGMDVEAWARLADDDDYDAKTRPMRFVPLERLRFKA